MYIDSTRGTVYTVFMYPELYSTFIFGVFGLIVGSYANVYILRLHTGKSTGGRSGCMSCGETLTYRDLVPVVSYFVLKGKCRKCGSHISHQYWLVEATMALLFASIGFYTQFISQGIFSAWLVTLLVIITVYDIRHTIIPNEVVYTFIASLIAMHIYILFYIPTSAVLPYIFNVVASGIVVPLPLFLLWLVSKGACMGFGDIKLTLGFGLALGIYNGLSAVFLGFIIGSIIGVGIITSQKLSYQYFKRGAQTIHMKSEIPFAPFLIAGFLLVYIFGFDVIGILQSITL